MTGPVGGYDPDESRADTALEYERAIMRIQREIRTCFGTEPDEKVVRLVFQRALAWAEGELDDVYKFVNRERKEKGRPPV